MSETADQASTRRRWITLAELVAVAGVVIAALTLWTNWSDRRADEAEKRAAASATAKSEGRVALVATIEDGGKRIALKDERHDIQEASIVFPRALGVAVQKPAGDPEIDADWIAKPLLKATDGGGDERTGRLPVVVTVRYWDGDAAHTSSATYDLVWRTEGHFLRGRSLRLEGLKRRSRGVDQAALDGWKAR